MTSKKIVLITLAAFAMLSLTGCFGLNIKSDVDYPTGLFKEKMDKITRIHAKDPGRKGAVSTFNMLVYIQDERKLISMSVPKALANAISGLDEDIRKEKDIKKYAGDFDLDKLKNLDRFGPGLLAEIEVDDGGNDKVHVLIWLE
ncbi:MAG: hypothetical protein GY940_09095 [bacterium]|nr:hypothetical protein [bacterium]